MRLLIFLSCFLTAALAQSDVTIEPNVLVSRPGVCKGSGRTTDCTKFGADYSCVAVESNIPGMEVLSQCVRGKACGSNINGKCPTFTSWPAKMRVVQPICAFTEVPNCENALNADGTSIVTANSNKTVACFGATFVSGNATKTVNGIYKCVDQKMYQDRAMGYLDLTEKHLHACAGNVTTNSNGVQTTLGLCNAHGTCTPTLPLGREYGCLCNSGYSTKDKCLVPVGNVCDGFGQCGSNGACNPKTGQCVCKPGATGDQCALCDVSAPKEDVCNGHGNCGIDGKCLCSPGREGLHCETVSKPPPTSKVPQAAGTDAIVSPLSNSAAAATLSLVSLVILLV
ncbi:hypothetical protein Ae201684_003532 [Aphanomyces euteiches]|uniref:EGF-like domain-containing protein n=1 Tax=Aphanomyces euteiches TaxID=100861 RepID=A0A6G0XLJ8_9STRA|nr:hypothetical protein Ae201684_003532 [Aphanomyces euteiches]KAH9145367.1 hypothetical protein AeRB84_010720 [Aphanomyces euteiches]